MTTQIPPSDGSFSPGKPPPLDKGRWFLAISLTVVLATVGLALGNLADDPSTEAAAALDTTTSQVTQVSTFGDASTTVTVATTTFPTTTTVATTSIQTTTNPTTSKPPAPAPSTPATSPPQISASGLAIPATKAYPEGLDQFGGYSIIASNADTGVSWWNAPYLGSNLPYTAGAQWISGDRQGYACAYGFIEDPNGEIDGRFTFVRPPDASYAKVNDKFMEEAERFYDGSLVEPSQGSEITSEDCSGAALSPIDYDTACIGVVDERPRVGFFDEQGRILDIRDYSNTDTSTVIFRLFSFNGSRATVIACEDGLVGMVVYYDKLGDGQLGVDFKGSGPFQS